MGSALRRGLRGVQWYSWVLVGAVVWLVPGSLDRAEGVASAVGVGMIVLGVVVGVRRRGRRVSSAAPRSGGLADRAGRVGSRSRTAVAAGLLAVATVAGYYGWMGWDPSRTDGAPDDGWRIFAFVVCEVVAVVLALVWSRSRRVMWVVPPAVVGCFVWAAVRATPSSDGLWVVGAILLGLGTLAGVWVVAAATDLGVRRMAVARTGSSGDSDR